MHIGKLAIGFALLFCLLAGCQPTASDQAQAAVSSAVAATPDNPDDCESACNDACADTSAAACTFESSDQCTAACLPGCEHGKVQPEIEACLGEDASTVERAVSK
ncbi:MAG TPA: hypothetical protein PKW95_14060 [bacterium]|nr:hypothetical protein [bacterium]